MSHAPGKSTIFRRANRSVLTVVADGLVYRGTVLKVSSPENISSGMEYISSKADMASALSEIASQIKLNNEQLPPSAILLSSQVNTMIIGAQLPPKNDLPYQKIHEIMRWEIEPYMTRIRERRIGTILLGRGYINREQLNNVIHAMDSHERKSVNSRPPRFGEIAVAAGLITEGELEECLNFQDSAEHFDGKAVCGWIPLGGRPADGKWKWLVAGVAESYRNHARECFRRVGVPLSVIYPIVGTAGAMLNGKGDKSCAIYEFQSGFVGYTRLEDGQVANSRIIFTQEADNPLKACYEIFETKADKIWLAGNWPNHKEAVRGINACLNKPCDIITFNADGRNGDLSKVAPCSAGAVIHYIFPDIGNRGVSIPAVDPQPPLISEPAFLSGFAMLVACTCLVAFAFYFNRERTRLDDISALQREVKSLISGIKKEKDNKSQLEAKLFFLKARLPQRRKLLPEIFDALQRSCLKEVIIKNLSEDNSGNINLKGWSMSPQHIESFKLRFREHLSEFIVTDGQGLVSSEKGPNSLKGYSFDLVIMQKKGGQK